MQETERVTCPFCHQRFDVRPLSTAKGFRCPDCGEEASLGVLRNPNLRTDAIPLGREVASATTANLHKHSAVFIFINREGSEDFASGTCVRLGKRYFLATVRHARPTGNRIAIVKKGPSLLKRTDEHFEAAVRWVASEDADVAAIELSTQMVRQAGLEPIGIERLQDRGPGDPNLVARLIGFPRAYRVENYERVGVKGYCALAYGCEPIEPERWIAIPSKPIGLSKDTHIIVDFNRDVVDYGPERPVPPGMPDPYGMSGGGIWQRPRRIEPGELWKPDDICLIGIQACWLVSAGFLIASQIIHWLKIVAEHYADLSDELCDRFPRLTSMQG